jgi:hypothetical protein
MTCGYKVKPLQSVKLVDPYIGASYEL